MKIKILIGTIVIMILVSCGGNKETVQIAGQNPDQKSTNGGGSGSGGADIGGGNSINGVLVDEFRQDVEQLPEYKKFLGPLIVQISENFPELAADFLHIIKRRNWYFIPAELKTLDPLNIGVPFSLKTEQVALHTPERIYIDNRIWMNTMIEDSRNFLLVHEIVMGIKWIDSHEGLDRCLAESYRIYIADKFTESENYRLKIRDCYKLYPKHFILTYKFKFTDGDKENIRILASNLVKFREKINWEELKLWIKSRDFRKYD